METKLRDMTGQQLLLLRILGSPAVQAAVETERDRRALSNWLDKGYRRPGRAKAVTSQSPQLVA